MLIEALSGAVTTGAKSVALLRGGSDGRSEGEGDELGAWGGNRGSPARAFSEWKERESGPEMVAARGSSLPAERSSRVRGMRKSTV